ncbi:hypothetical protein [Persephonella sp.]|uniref:hypothetical protein n=1 Tax=Persephonella sp. TaxID=2060922 RepID=UPI0025FA99A5|nr:hypothetical protein [Persephonella sp.]
MSKIDTHKEIYMFLKGESDLGMEIISNIFFKQLHSASFNSLAKNEEEKKELLMKFFYKLFQKREYILKKFANQNRGLSSFIRKMIKNFLKDELRTRSEKELKKVSIDEPLIEKTINNPIEIINEIEAYRLSELLEKRLTEEDFKMICYIIIQNSEEKLEYEKSYFSDISKDALYKRVQRVKEKLRKIINKEHFAKETVQYYLENILPTKCKRS